MFTLYLMVTTQEDPVLATGTPAITHHQVDTNGTTLHVATAGQGPAVVLLHGWPHTWQLWTSVIPALAATHRVIAPDLRGLGDSHRAADGYDLHTLAADIAGLLRALGETRADIVGIDAGSPVAFMLAMRRPSLIRRLVLMESLLGGLPGAERFLAAGPPWWFGFHAVPGLAETVLAGHEGEYLDWFLRAGTADGRGIDPAVRDAFVRAYQGADALRCGFSYYRAGPVNSQQIAAATDAGRLLVPTMAVGARPVGDSLYRQLEPVTDQLTGHLIEDCGHIIPLDRPDALLGLLIPFLA
jgi:pimeloyl-ACP methyl ester carboxylesterase